MSAMLRIEPGPLQSRVNLGVVPLFQGRAAEAEPYLAEAAQGNPGPAEVADMPPARACSRNPDLDVMHEYAGGREPSNMPDLTASSRPQLEPS